MSFEPRMRGRRFGRPVAKKSSAKNKREPNESAGYHEQATPITPAEIRFSTLNALEHLGKQRFVLPPFSEHFQRWMNDVRSVLVEFETQLPQIADQEYKETIENILRNLQMSLNELTGAESKISEETAETQREFSACENELSRLEHEYKAVTSQLRRQQEQSFEKLRQQIDTLDKQRLRIIHTKPTLLQRLFRKPDMKLTEKTSALQSKKTALGNRKEALKLDLEKYRNDYDQKHKELLEKSDSLRAKMMATRKTTLGDAVELRSRACSDLSEALRHAADKLPKQDSRDAEETPESHVIQQ